MTGIGTARSRDHALLAREILALAEGGTLHVRGLADAAASLQDATFFDDGGRPTFVVPADTALVDAARARQGAVLAVPAGAHTGWTQLVLGGHLAVLAAPDPEVDPAEGVVAVGLLVHTVVLEHDQPDGRPVGYRTVPLDAWTAAVPDPMRPTAQRILRHANASHGSQLRDFVAGLRGIAPDEIIAAELAELDATGVDVRWVDLRGAHRARIRFARRAGCPGELAAQLRATLHS